MQRTPFLLFSLILLTSSAGAATPTVHSFEFEYGFHLTNLPPGKTVCVWLPVPPSNDYQTVKQIPAAKLPAKATVGEEKTYGNRMFYFEATVPASGTLTVNVPYLVKRWEVLREDVARKDNTPLRPEFLKANQLVPLNGKPQKLTKNLILKSNQTEAARQLYDFVDQHVKYDKSGTGWGTGNAEWVCESGFGNCTDFHSLFISLARSQGIPARFEIGFSIPTNEAKGSISGYHCWAAFHTKQTGWIPVDISEADKNPQRKNYYFGNLTANRITFSIGRDLTLAPKQNGAPVNFFVYPHVEIEGKPIDNKHLKTDFRYRFVDERLP